MIIAIIALLPVDQRVNRSCRRRRVLKMLFDNCVGNLRSLSTGVDVESLRVPERPRYTSVPQSRTRAPGEKDHTEAPGAVTGCVSRNNEVRSPRVTCG